VKADELKQKVDIGHPPDVVPARAVTLIGYADVQGAANGLYYQIWAFGPGEEAWLVRYGQCDTFDDFEQLALDTEYPYEDGRGGLRCVVVGYDTGDGNRTNEIYERQRLRPNDVILTKGWEVLNGGEKWRPASIEYYPSGRRDPHSIRLHDVNTSFFKGKLLQLYKRPGDGPGVLHLHREVSQAFLDQATSEHSCTAGRRRSRRASGCGRRRWRAGRTTTST
jgi:phage terminase large subunit GpA-like protein